MIANVEDVIRWLDLNGCKYFVVQLKDGDNARVFESDESRSFDDNIANFRRVMDVSRANRYIIKAAITKDSKRGNYLEEFKNISDATPTMSGTPQTVMQGLSEDEVDKRATRKFEELMMKRELEELRAENKELSKEVNRRTTVGEQFLERVSPYMGTIIPALMEKFLPQGANIVMQGLYTKKTNEMETEETIQTPVEEITLTDEQSDRAEAALQKWAAADPGFLEYIEAFADFAASGKSIKAGFMTLSYAQVKEMFGPEKLREMLNS